MSEFRKYFSKNISKIPRLYSPLDFGISSRVQEKSIKKWISCEFFFENPPSLLRAYFPSFLLPSTLESRVQEKGIKKWVSFEQNLRKSSVTATLPLLDFGISCPGEGRQNMSKLRKKSRKSSMPTSSHRLWSLLSRRRGSKKRVSFENIYRKSSVPTPQERN